MNDVEKAAVRAVIQLLQDRRDVLSTLRDKLFVDQEQFPSANPPVGEGPEDGNYPRWIHTVPGNEDTARKYDDLGRSVREIKTEISTNEYVSKYLEAL